MIIGAAGSLPLAVSFLPFAYLFFCQLLFPFAYCLLPIANFFLSDCLSQVLHQIIRVFHSNADAEQTIRDAETFAFFFGDRSMCHRSRVTDERFNSAK